MPGSKEEKGEKMPNNTPVTLSISRNVGGSKKTIHGGFMSFKCFKSIGTVAFMFISALSFSLAGCGGGGGDLSSHVVSGVASVGATLSGQVSLKDASTTPQSKTTVIDSDGSYAIDVTGMKAPFILEATGSAGGTSYTLHSYAAGPGTANINPLSEVVVAIAAGVDDPAQIYSNPDAAVLQKIGSDLQSTITTLQAKFQPLLQQYGAGEANPVTGSYKANHAGLDGMFDNVKFAMSKGILTVTDEKTGVVIFIGKFSEFKNWSFPSDPGTLPPPQPAPTAPTGVSATGGTGQVTLSWTSVSNATSYNVYYRTTSGVAATNGTKIAGTTSPYVHTGLTSGTTYYYVVTAVNSAGESVASTQASATTTAAPPPPPPVPATPTGVSATGGTKQATVSWPAVSGATSYNIYWAKTSGVTTASGTKIAGATSPAVQMGLSDSTTFYYIVTAVNASGESLPSVQVAATTLTPAPAPTPPVAPTGLTATGGASQVTLTWSAVTGATSYNVYYSAVSGAGIGGTKIAGVTSPYVHTGLSAGTTYYYVVTAVNAVGESAAAAQAGTATNAPPPAVPAAPTGVTATGGANQVTVSWATVSGATSYNIYWAKTSGVTTTTGTKITGATTPYSQTGLSAGTSYYYIVTAVNSSGESPASAQATATTNVPVPVIPATPTGVTATGGANQVSLSWTAVSGAASYNIYWATTSGVTKTTGTKIVNAASPYVQTGLAAGSAYYYVVTAVNNAGESAASAQAMATTNAAPPPTCGSCHAIPPAMGSHSAHSFSCATCHGTGYSATTVNATTHMNGVKNVVGTSGWNATSRSCSNSCHGSRSW
jgi:fibronectin type 3 domain-containing protein